MSFYNTYRPKTFEEIDNSQVRSLLASLLSKKREQLPHAFFLTGPRGIGKTTTARIIAKLFNCLTPNANGEPCGSCELCVRIGQGNAIDVLEMDAASNTGVDNIRDLKDKIMLAPSQGKWKVYIIDEVHMLSTGAFNALLKTLEEPPKNTVFVLATTDPQKVPDTIRSRCLHLQFKKPDIQEIISALSRIATMEQLAIDQASLKLLAESADGSFRDATKLLEQASLLSKKVTIETIQSILSLPEQTVLDSFIQLLAQKDAANLIATIERLTKEGTDIREFFTRLLKQLHTLLITSIIEGKTTPLSQSDLTTLVGILLNTYNTIRGSVLPELALELAILEYCSKGTPTPQVTPKPKETSVPVPKPLPESPKLEPVKAETQPQQSPGTLTTERLIEHWGDVVNEVKIYNHSVSGVLRSTRPKSVINGIVTIEAFYTFHKDKLSDIKAREAIGQTIKKLFGEKVGIELILGKK